MPVGQSATPPAPTRQLNPQVVQIHHQLPPVIGDDMPSLRVELPFRNDSGKPVRIVEVRPACGASSKAELAKQELAPGESTVLVVTLNLANRSGLQRSAITLKSDQETLWFHQYEIQVYPRAAFSVPNNQLHWSKVEPLDRLTQTLAFEVNATAASQLPQQIVFRTEGQVTTKVGEPETRQLAPSIWQRRFPLVVEQQAPAQAGPLHGTVHAVYAFGGTEQTSRLGLTGYAASVLAVTPEYVFFAPGDGPKKVTIRRRDGKPLEVKVAPPTGTSAPAVESMPTESAGLCQLRVEPPSTQAGPHWSELVVTTNHEKQQVLRIPIAAMPKQGGATTTKEQ